MFLKEVKGREETLWIGHREEENSRVKRKKQPCKKETRTLYMQCLAFVTVVSGSGVVNAIRNKGLHDCCNVQNILPFKKSKSISHLKLQFVARIAFLKCLDWMILCNEGWSCGRIGLFEVAPTDKKSNFAASAHPLTIHTSLPWESASKTLSTL